MTDMQEAHARIHREWHRAASQRDGAALIALYADDAVLESPLVPALLGGKTDGVLRGKAEIQRFLEAGARSRPIDLVRAGTAPTPTSISDRRWSGNIPEKRPMATRSRSSR